MTQPLVSPGLINKMRKIANRALQAPVIILQQLPVAEGEYGDDVLGWVTVDEVPGWLKMTNTPHLDDQGGVVGSIGVFRLHMDADVQVRPGDMVAMLGNEYLIQDDNHEDTYRVFTTATLRRRQ